jgi:transposase
MSEKRKKYDREFREGAVRIVEETGKSIAAVARDLGIHEGTLGNWVARAREAREGRGELTRDDLAELKLNRPGMSGDSIGWEGWSHAREYVEEVPARVA